MREGGGGREGGREMRKKEGGGEGEKERGRRGKEGGREGGRERPVTLPRIEQC